MSGKEIRAAFQNGVQSLMWRTKSSLMWRSYVSILDDIGPVQNAIPKPKSNRSPKPGKTTILTSPENVAAIKEKLQKRKSANEQKEANAAKKRMKKNTSTKVSKVTKGAGSAKKKRTPTKAARAIRSKNKSPTPSTTSSEEEGIKCEGCGDKVDPDEEIYTCAGLNCRRIAHQNCITLTYSMWNCKNCDSDGDISS